MKKVDDEMLMALADGELDRDTAAEVARAVEADPALARRLDDFQRSRKLAKLAYADVIEDKVPARLLAAAGGATRQPARPARTWAAWSGWLVGGMAGAAAAAIVLALLRPGDGSLSVPVPFGGEIAAALDTGASGEIVLLAGGGSVDLTATYVTAGGICRSFRTVGGSNEERWFAVACRHDGAWHISVAAAEGGDGFLPAADAAVSSVDAFLDVVGAGEGLDESEESRLRANGWSE